MTGGDFLERMAATSHGRLDAAREILPDRKLMEQISLLPHPPGLSLSNEGFDLIAEVKRRSPSAGQLAGEGLEPAVQAEAYAAGGAAALSVLTEPSEFSGELKHLTDVAQAVHGVPAMRKDFLVSPYQVMEARAAGAGGVLLIAAMLDATTLAAMLRTSFDLGMFALVEAFDERDLAHCVPVMEAMGPMAVDGHARLLLGINCRDLRTLQVDFQRFEQLAGALPDSFPRVAESGVNGPAEAKVVAGLGYQLALVGSALMQADEPSVAAAALLEAGRSV